MLELNRILLITPTEMTRSPAFERAHALASATGARLHLLAFDPVQALAGPTLFGSETRAQALQRYRQRHRHWLEEQQYCGLSVTTEVLGSRLSLAQVLEYVNAFHADMVIKDMHHVPALDHAFLCPMDWQLLRDCPAHLHLVTAAKHTKRLKVLAAIDLSHLEQLTQGLNDRILDLALSLAADCGAVLQVLNVNKWVAMGAVGRSVPIRSLYKSLRDAVNDVQDEALDLLAERYGIDKRQCHHLTGIPHQVITHFVRQQAFDILVLGAAYQHGSNRIIGSTVENLLNQPPCSLVLVKPEP